METSRITLTASDIEFAASIGSRATWPDAMIALGIGTHATPIMLIRAANDDTGADGTISHLPESSLYSKLVAIQEWHRNRR